MPGCRSDVYFQTPPGNARFEKSPPAVAAK